MDGEFFFVAETLGCIDGFIHERRVQDLLGEDVEGEEVGEVFFLGYDDFFDLLSGWEGRQGDVREV